MGYFKEYKINIFIIAAIVKNKNDAYVTSVKEKEIHAVILNHCICVYCLPRVKQTILSHFWFPDGTVCNVISETTEEIIFLVSEST